MDSKTQIGIINATGPIEAYRQGRESFEADIPEVDAIYDSIPDLDEGPTATATKPVVDTEFQNKPIAEPLNPDDSLNTYDDRTGKIDLEVPMIPGSAADVSRGQILREQRRNDIAEVDADVKKGNEPPPNFLWESVENFGGSIYNLPQGLLDVGMSVAAPLGSLGSFALAPYADTETPRGDNILEQVQTDFTIAFKAMTDSLGGGHDNYGEQIAQKRFGLEGNAATTVGLMMELAADPTIGVGAAFFKTIQKGLAIKKAGVGAGVAKADTGNIITNGMYELLTFGKEMDVVDIGRKAKAAGNNPAEVKKIQANALKTKQTVAAKSEKVIAATKLVDANPTPENVKALHDVLNDVPELDEVAKLKDMEDATQELEVYKGILGDTAGTPYTTDLTNVSDESLKATLSGNTTVVPVRLNLARTDTVEKADAVLDELVEKHISTFESIGGSAKSLIEETRQNNLLRDFTGDAKILNQPAAEAYAARQILVSSAAHLGELAKKVRSTSGNKIHDLAFERALAAHLRMRERYSGRTGAASKIYDTYNMKGFDSATESARANVGRLSRQTEKAARSEELSNLTKEFMSFETDPAVISKIAEGSRAQRTADMAFEIYVNAILSGPITHAVNIASNSLLTMWAPLENTVEAFGPAFRGDLAGASDKILEASVRVGGVLEGMSDAMRILSKQADWDDLKLDGSKFATGEIAKMRLKPAITSTNAEAAGKFGQAIDIIGTVIRIPGGALQKADKLFKLLHYRSELNAQAIIAARKSGHAPSEQIALYNTLRHNPTKGMVDEGIKLGELNTFTNELGKKGTHAHKLIKSMPMGRFLIPFFATPSNIVTMGLRHSVLGQVWTEKNGWFGELGLALKDGGPVGDTARAKLALGTLIPATIISQLDEERITGRIDTKTEKGRFDASQNKPPYSIRIGDKWVSYEKLEPFRSVVGMYVNWRDAVNAMETHDEEGVETNEYMEIASAAIAPVIGTIGDTYMLQALGGIINVLNSLSTGNGDYALVQLEKMATSALPYSGLARQINNTVLDGSYRMANTVVEKIMKITPGLSDMLPARPTVWGDPQLYPAGIGPDIISPFKTKAVKFDAYDQLLTDLNVDVPGIPKSMRIPLKGYKGKPVPGMPSVRVELTVQEQHRLGMIRGKGFEGNTPLKEVFKEVINGEGFLKQPDSLQAKQLNAMFAHYTDMAKQGLFAEGSEPGGIQDKFKVAVEQKKLQLMRSMEENKGKQL